MRSLHTVVAPNHPLAFNYNTLKSICIIWQCKTGKRDHAKGGKSIQTFQHFKYVFDSTSTCLPSIISIRTVTPLPWLIYAREIFNREKQPLVHFAVNEAIQLILWPRFEGGPVAICQDNPVQHIYYWTKTKLWFYDQMTIKHPQAKL